MLLSRMTLAEKASQMLFTSPAIERLGIPAYNWWNEALHGLGRAGVATVFPQAIGLAATWNPDADAPRRRRHLRRSAGQASRSQHAGASARSTAG